LPCKELHFSRMVLPNNTTRICVAAVACEELADSHCIRANPFYPFKLCTMLRGYFFPQISADFPQMERLRHFWGREKITQLLRLAVDLS